MPYAARAPEATEAKQRIGRAIAALIADGETVILDSGTTALASSLEAAGLLVQRA
jgi:DeoR family transcriptional regulator, fructose operon transcriptional repressor